MTDDKQNLNGGAEPTSPNPGSPGADSSPPRVITPGVSTPASAAAFSSRPDAKTQSHLFGISVRAWLATIIIGTVAAMCLLQIEVPAPLWTLLGAVITYFFTPSNSAKPTIPSKP